MRSMLVVLPIALLVGPRAFQDSGLGLNGPMWSYAYLAMIVILAPAVTDGVRREREGSRYSPPPAST